MIGELFMIRLVLMMIFWAIASFILIYDFEGKETFNKRSWLRINVIFFFTSYILFIVGSYF